MLKRALHFLTFSLVGLLVIGCSSLDTLDTPPVPSNNPIPFPGFTFPRVDLANFIIPLPNDILLDPVTGLVSIPPPEGASETVLATFDALNSIDGFSTSGAIIIPFTGTVKPETVNNDTIQVFNTTTGAQVSMAYEVSEVTAGSVVTMLPNVVFEEETTYVVVVSSGVISARSNTPIISDNAINLLKQTTPLVDGNGNSTNSALDNATAARLEGIRLLSQPGWAAAETATGVNRADIPYAFNITTQSLYDTLVGLRSSVVAMDAPMVNPIPGTPPLAIGHGPVVDPPPPLPNIETFFNAAGPPLSSIPAGTLAAIGRIYLVEIDIPIYRTDIVEGFWDNPPVQVGTRAVPALVFLPQSTSAVPGSPPVPAVIFQHGLGGNKFQAGILAGAVNATGQALVAIDLEQHGALSAANTMANPVLPFLDPDPLFPGDPAGDVSRTLNLTNLRNSRDNLRASSVNLYGLTQAIFGGQSDMDGAPGNELVAGPPTYISLSLGSIVGQVFHATEANIARSNLNVGGGRISRILVDSESLSETVLSGLAANGITPGTPLFGQFFIAAQTVIDDADPINYARKAIDGDLRGGTTASQLNQVNTTDAVVPPIAQYDQAIQAGQGASTPPYSQVEATTNSAPIAALARAIVAQAASPFVGSGFYEINNAGHGAILDPSAGPTALIVGQALTYLGTGTIVGNAALHRAALQQVTEDLTIYESFDPFKLYTK